jgi:hypothetical protein
MNAFSCGREINVFNHPNGANPGANITSGPAS